LSILLHPVYRKSLRFVLIADKFLDFADVIRYDTDTISRHQGEIWGTVLVFLTDCQS